jgi:hypothetical protein
MKYGHRRAIHPHWEGILKACGCCLELRMYSPKIEHKAIAGEGNSGAITHLWLWVRIFIIHDNGNCRGRIPC